MTNYGLQITNLTKVRNGDKLLTALTGRLADWLTGRLIYLVTGKPENWKNQVTKKLYLVTCIKTNDYILNQGGRIIFKEKASIKCLGIMGGVFDPIHYGHLFTAEEARVEFKLDKVIFVPCRQPAHKRENNISDPEHRYLMTVLATRNNQFFEVSKVELNRPGPSYSIDTVKEFLKKYNQRVKIFFISGADAFLEIDSWYKSEEILKICQFVAATRPGYDLNKLDQKFKKIIKIMEIPALYISSTDIRKRIKEGRNIKYLVPYEVEKYIFEKGLYFER